MSGRFKVTSAKRDLERVLDEERELTERDNERVSASAPGDVDDSGAWQDKGRGVCCSGWR